MSRTGDAERERARERKREREIHIIKTRSNISASQPLSNAVHHENEKTRNRKY